MNVENERKNFEQWVTKVAPLNAFFETYPDGKYQCESNQLAWEGWQARATLQQEAKTPTVQKLESLIYRHTRVNGEQVLGCYAAAKAVQAAWRPIPSVDEIETVLESVTEDYSAYINKRRTTLQAQAIHRAFGGET